jgi:glucose/arabinose dehydrogenase
MVRLRWLSSAALSAGLLTLLSFPAAAADSLTRDGRFTLTAVSEELENPWGLAFLPDGRLLVTERPGRLRVVSTDGRLSEPLANVPQVYHRGQGGLLDVALDPDFASNRTVYLSYAEPGEDGAGTAVARARLSDAGLSDLAVIFRQQPKVDGRSHFGSRLVFAPDGTLFVTLGDRFAYREEAQNLANHFGKVVRINRDGSVPPDNPFVGRDGAKPEIWSYGHRNVQGATLDPATGRLWTAEHGARGGDEINRPEAGRNYGWPVITYGVDYSGARIGEGTAKPGMEQPVHYWDPSIAPSGMTFYTGDAFPDWRGDLFVGSLKFGYVARLDVEDGRIVGEERLIEDLDQRIRDVRQGPDGNLYLLTDEDEGAVLKLAPASKS